jgi:anti-anti-sigma factor
MRPLGSSFFTIPGRPPLPGEGLKAGPTVVWLRGEHDIATDGELRRILSRAIALNDASLVLDLSKLDLISGSTLGVIVTARKFLRQQSRSLTLRSPTAQVRRIIGICGLDDLLGPGPEERDGGAENALGSWVAVPMAGRGGRQPGPVTTVPARVPAHVGQVVDLTTQAASIDQIPDIA